MEGNAQASRTEDDGGGKHERNGEGKRGDLRGNEAGWNGR